MENTMRKGVADGPHSSLIQAFFLFTVYTFIYLLMDMKLLNDEAGITQYALSLFATALGYLIFFLVGRLRLAANAKKLMSLAWCLIFLTGAIGVIVTSDSSLYHIFAMLASVGLGYIGGTTHYYTAMSLHKSRHTGRVVGLAFCLALLAQYFVDRFLDGSTALIIALALGSMAYIYIIFFPPRDWVLEGALKPDSGKSPNARRAMILLVTLAVMLTVQLAMPENVIRSDVFFDGTGYTAWPRLIFAASALLAGIIADLKWRLLLGPAVCCALMPTVIVPFFLGNDSYQWLSSLLTYIFAGFYTVSLTVMFFSRATDSGNPRLWACMGRFIRCLITAIMVPATMGLYDKLKADQVYLVSIGLAIAMVCVLLVFMLSRAWRARDNEYVPLTRAASLNDESLAAFAAANALTPRETEVLSKVLKSEKSIRELAAELLLSERVAQRYLTSIYEKTGTKSRIGLFIAFYGNGEIKK